MASKKPQHPVEVPLTGVRKDVDPLVRTPEMASKGGNCLYFDGTIRPRPALATEIGENGELFPFFKQIFLSDPTEWVEACGIMLSGYILATITDDTWRLSLDFGETWSEPAIDHPGVPIYHIEEQNGYIFAFGASNVYRAEAADLPTSLTWTNIAAITLTWGNKRHRFYYDSTNDAFIILKENDNLDETVGVVALYDASTTGTASVLTTGITLGGDFFRVDGLGGWMKEEWLVFGMREGEYSPGWTPKLSGTQKLVAIPLEWTGSAYTLGDMDDSEQKLLLRSNSQVPTYYNPLDLVDPVNSECGIGPLDITANNQVTFVCLATAGDSHICSVDLTSDGWGVDAHRSLTTMIRNEDVRDYRFSDKKLLYVIDGGLVEGVDLKPSLFVSSDSGVSWVRFDNEWQLDYSYSELFFVSNRTLDVHLVVGKSLLGVPAGGFPPPYGEIWRLPTGGLPPDLSLDGDLSSIIQLDLDEEDDAIIVGTSKALHRLSIVNNEWDRITADQDQTVDTGATGTWIETGDIPPLSVSPDDSEYVSGVTIDANYGENPWVFRSVEGQGKTFLIGTNGQCYPICYHEDMPGGFARRLGEMTPADPNYIADVTGLPAGYLTTGNLAPKAKCLAIGANRVLLGNMVGGSPYGVEVSGFNDHDRGWGLEQFTLLGDTPGPIVTMNEISALSVALYKTDAIYHAIAQTEFLGVAAPFRFELAKAGISGPCSPASVLRNFDGRHIYLARDGGVYMYDSVAPLDGGRNIRRMIQGKLNHNELGKVWGMVDPMRKLVWFFYPTEDGEVNEGLVISTDQGYPWPVWPIKLPAGWNFTAGSAVTLTDDISIGEIGRLGDYSDETLSSFSTGEKAMLMGLKDNNWVRQKWVDDGDYTDSGVPIQIDLETGWLTPGGVQINRADELYHIFSSPDPEQELEVRLKAQQIGQNIRYSKWSSLSAGKLRRRTRHRVSGAQFAVQMRGGISRIFNWGGGMLTITKSGDR